MVLRVLPMVPRQSQSYVYISNAEGVVVTQSTPPMVPRQSQSYVYISNAEVVIVTQAQWAKMLFRRTFAHILT